MKHTLNPRDFEVQEGKKIDLREWPTEIKPFYKSKEDYEEILAKHTEALSALQNLLYADNRYALLLIFQAMDAAGKDGAIKHVMSGVNPQGCQVYSFKHPSAEGWNTIFFGGLRSSFPSADESASSTVLTTRKCSS
jgi:polyphosphate kinase 2 (PPK2 family)